MLYRAIFMATFLRVSVKRIWLEQGMAYHQGVSNHIQVGGLTVTI